MGFQIVLAVASESGYTLYRRSVPALLEFPRGQVTGLTAEAARVATAVPIAAIGEHLHWQTDTGVYVVDDEEYWQALAVSLDVDADTTASPGGCLVKPARGDSLLRLYIRGQGAREVGSVLYQEHGVSASAVRDAIETVLRSWGTVVPTTM